MRKTSQDGGDSTSITSGFENELRKASVGIMKTKRNSIKRKVQNFSHESDDTVIEPLLQIDKNETANRSAKYLLSKSKTDSLGERDSNILYSDNNVEKSSVSKYIGTTAAITTSTNISRTLHNHMNTNVFGGHDISKVVTTVKSPVLVEISENRPAIRSNQTSSIFTTAKIHADSITKNMEPIQVTPVPILSTVEGNVVKAGISPDYSQNKNIIPSTSSGILKPSGSQDKVQISNTHQYDGSHLARSEVGKSDPFRYNTEHTVKKLSDVLDNRSTVLTTESELKLISKTTDAKKENVKASSMAKSIENEIVSNITPQPKQSISTTSDKKIKTMQENRDDDRKDIKSVQKISDVKNTEVGGRITLQNQNASNLQSAVIKKEDKNISSGNKQLQRQKNAVCESDKLDDVISNEPFKVPKNIVSTTSTSSAMPSSKSKDNLTQFGVSLKSDTETGKKMQISSTQVRKPVTENLSFIPITIKEVKQNDPVQPIQSTTALKIDLKETKTSVGSSLINRPTDVSSLVTTTSTKSVASKSIEQDKSKSSTASFRSDLAIEKKIVTTASPMIKPATENSSLIAVTTKGDSPKVVDTVQSKPSSVLGQSDSLVKGKMAIKPTDICKPTTAENVSITSKTTKSQKSTAAVTTTQSTGTVKPDSIKENKTVGSNLTSKSAIDNSSHITGSSKGVTQKPNTATPKSINSNSVSAKDSKSAVSSVQTNKSSKDKTSKEDLTPKSSSTSTDKLLTTDKKGSAKSNTIQNLKNSPVSKDISKVVAPSSASADSKSAMASIQPKTDKTQNKTLPEDKSITPITALPTSGIPITKTEVKPQTSTVVPSTAKSSIVSKVEASSSSGVKSSPPVSSIPITTSTSTTTLPKTTSQKTTSKTNVLDKHGKI